MPPLEHAIGRHAILAITMLGFAGAPLSTPNRVYTNEKMYKWHLKGKYIHDNDELLSMLRPLCEQIESISTNELFVYKESVIAEKLNPNVLTIQAKQQAKQKLYERIAKTDTDSKIGWELNSDIVNLAVESAIERSLNMATIKTANEVLQNSGIPSEIASLCLSYAASFNAKPTSIVKASTAGLKQQNKTINIGSNS